MKPSNEISLLFGLLIAYLIIKVLPFGNFLLYPFNLIVTFLHEFGHAFFALLTWGAIKSIQINTDGSGLAQTAGGWKMFILMGGYIGSALWGNLLLFLSVKGSQNTARYSMYLLGGLMMLFGVFFSGGILSTCLLLALGGSLITIASKWQFNKQFLGFIGLASLVQIVLDFRVWPSSDLAKFSEIFVIIPQVVWMYVWLLIVVGSIGGNIRWMMRR